MTTEQWLKDSVLFQELSDEEIDRIKAIAEAVSYQRGEILFKEGDEADSILLIESGMIRVTKGADQMELLTTGFGELIGELSFLDGGTRSASATAEQRTKVLRIPNDKLRELLSADKDLANRFYLSAVQYVCRRLRQTTDMLHLVRQSAEQVILSL